MKTVKYYFIVTLSFLYLGGYAQNYSVENSLEFLLAGIEQHQDGNYSAAIKEYSKIHRNDTNYAIALYEISLAQIAKEDYSGTIETCKKGLQLKSEYDNSFYTNLGTAYSESEEYKSAIDVYTLGLKQFPRSSTLKYNKAVALIRDKQYDDGLDLVYETLRENPYHANSHWLLGSICEDQELESQALLSYSMYLVMSTDDASFERLKHIDGYVNGAMKGENEYDGIVIESESFEDVDELISNKVAIDNKYKTPSKLTFPIIKQLHLLLTQLDGVSEKGSFWNEYYVPFFSKIMKVERFAGFSYYLTRSGNYRVKDVTKYYKRFSSKVNNFIAWYHNVFPDLYGNQEVDGEIKEHHYSDGVLVGIGNRTGEDFNGAWQFFYGNGALAREGVYKNGNKNGVWTGYYNNGIQKDFYTWDNGDLQGDFKEYNDKGILTREGKFKKDYYNGPVLYYFETGGLDKMQEFDMGTLNGKLEYYFKNGQKRVEATFVDGDVDGDVIYYGVNGQTTQIKTYENGEINGTMKTWYIDGTLSGEYEYKDGELHGSYKSYHKNGQLRTESEYKEGNTIGKSTSYHENGKVESERTFDETGKESGTTTTYFDDGKVLSTHTYRKGELESYVFYDHDGNVLSENKKSGKTMAHKRYDKNGYLVSTGDYLRDEQDGVWTYYYAGIEKPMSKLEYSEGNRSGSQKYFYSSGDLKKEYECTDGDANGEYNEYLMGNKNIVINTGYYRNDNLVGEFIRKNALDIVTSKSYYVDDESHGWQTYYSQDGKLAREFYYNQGIFYGTVYYDTLGNVRDTVWLENGTGEFKDYFADGNIRFIGNYKNGEADGKFTWYHPNGKVSSTGEYVNGNKNGEWKSFFPDGKTSYIYHYNFGNLEGEYISYFSDGTIEYKATYKDDELEGKYFKYFWNGKKREESVYKNGQREGVCTYYVPTGDVAIIRTFVEDILVSYSYLGKDKKTVAEIPVTGEEQKIIAYYPNGKKSVEYTIENNDYNGYFTWYYPTGKVYKKTQYVNGLIDGTMEAFTPQGTTYYTYTYKHGQEHGVCIDYYPSGELKSKYTYFMGDLEGKTLKYDKSGKLFSTRYYFEDTYYGGNF